jgi:hypothetical protein
MDSLLAYGSGSEGNDDNGEQQKKQATSREEEGNSGETTGFLPMIN